MSALNKRRRPHSQNSKILEYLERGYTLTPLEGLELFGTMNLAQRIAQLRTDGHEIKDRWIVNSNGTRFKEYYLGN